MRLYKNQSISNIIRWNAGLLGRSSRCLMVQSLFDRLALEHFKGLIKIMKIIARGILQKVLKYWTIRRRDDRPSKPATQRFILEID